MSKGCGSISSMGNDTPLRYYQRYHNFYNYFKQLFAQVTNPPLDGIREEIITDISLAIGGDYNILILSKQCKAKIQIQ
jgi:glutamate synthase (ferredoxin)